METGKISNLIAERGFGFIATHTASNISSTPATLRTSTAFRSAMVLLSISDRAETAGRRPKRSGRCERTRHSPRATRLSKAAHPLPQKIKD
jgi:hypothetical protein